jgi:hypothetical protein
MAGGASALGRREADDQEEAVLMDEIAKSFIVSELEKWNKIRGENPYPSERQKTVEKTAKWDYDPRIKLLAEWLRHYCYAHEAIDDVMDGKEGWTFYAKDAVDALEMLDNALDEHGSAHELSSNQP